MYLGRFVELGPTEDVSGRPLHPMRRRCCRPSRCRCPRRMRSDHRIILQGRNSESDRSAFRLPLPHPLPVCASCLCRAGARLARTRSRSLGRLPFRRSAEFFAKLTTFPFDGGQCHDEAKILAPDATRREAMALISGAVARRGAGRQRPRAGRAETRRYFAHFGLHQPFEP